MIIVKKYESLKLNRDFHRMYTKGKSFVSPVLVTYVMNNKNRPEINRIGIIAGKKIGNSVQRNRCRRIIRQAFINMTGEIKTGYDFVFVARTRTVNSNTNHIYQFMKKHLESAGVMK